MAAKSQSPAVREKKRLRPWLVYYYSHAGIRIFMLTCTRSELASLEIFYHEPAIITASMKIFPHETYLLYGISLFV